MFGDVLGAAVVPSANLDDASACGYGYAHFAESSAADAAVAALSGELLGSQRVVALKLPVADSPGGRPTLFNASPPSTTNAATVPPISSVRSASRAGAGGGAEAPSASLLITNLETNVGTFELQNSFTAFGEVTAAAVAKDKATGKSLGYAVVTYASAAEAAGAAAASNGMPLRQNRLRVTQLHLVDEAGARLAASSSGNGGGDEAPPASALRAGDQRPPPQHRGTRVAVRCPECYDASRLYSPAPWPRWKCFDAGCTQGNNERTFSDPVYSCRTPSTCGWAICSSCHARHEDPAALVGRAKQLQDRLVETAHRRLLAAGALPEGKPAWSGFDTPDGSWVQHLPAHRLQCERLVLQDKAAIAEALDSSITDLVEHQHKVLRAVWSTEADVQNKLGARLVVADRFMHRLNVAVEQLAAASGPSSSTLSPTPASEATSAPAGGTTTASIPPSPSPLPSPSPSPHSVAAGGDNNDGDRSGSGGPPLDPKAVTVEFFVKTGIVSLVQFLSQAWEDANDKAPSAVNEMAAEAGRSLLVDGLTIVRDLEPAALAKDCRPGAGTMWHGVLTKASTQLLMLCDVGSPVPPDCQAMAMELALELTVQTGSAAVLLDVAACVLDRASHLDEVAPALAGAVATMLPRITSLCEQQVKAGPKQTSGNGARGADDTPAVATVPTAATSLLAAGGDLLGAIQQLQPRAPDQDDGDDADPEVYSWSTLGADPLLVATVENNTGGIATVVSAEVTFVLSVSGDLFGIGENKNSLFGVQASSMPIAAEPFLIPFPAQHTKIASVSTTGHVVAAAQDGSVYSWGPGGSGQLGHGDTATELTPKAIKGLEGHRVVSVACGSRCSAAITASGKLFTWGHGSNCRLGHSVSGDKLVPTLVRSFDGTTPAKKAAQIALGHGDGHGLVLAQDGTVWSFGSSSHGRLGRESAGNEGPGLVSIQGRDCVGVFAGNAWSAVLTQAGEVYTFGSNDAMQLGLANDPSVPAAGSKSNRDRPTMLVMPEGAASIKTMAVGPHFSLAVAMDGRMYVWGQYRGAAGGSSVPVEVPELSNIGLSAGCVGSHLLLWKSTTPLNLMTPFNMTGQADEVRALCTVLELVQTASTDEESSAGALAAVLVLLKSHLSLTGGASVRSSTGTRTSASSASNRIRSKVLALAQNTDTPAPVLHQALDALFVGWSKLGGTADELAAIRRMLTDIVSVTIDAAATAAVPAARIAVAQAMFKAHWPLLMPSVEERTAALGDLFKQHQRAGACGFLVGLLLETLNSYANFAAPTSNFGLLVPSAIDYCCKAAISRLEQEDGVRADLLALREAVEVAASARSTALANLHSSLGKSSNNSTQTKDGEGANVRSGSSGGGSSGIGAALKALQDATTKVKEAHAAISAKERGSYTADASFLAAMQFCTTHQRVLLSKLRSADNSADEMVRIASEVSHQLDTTGTASIRVLDAVNAWLAKASPSTSSTSTTNDGEGDWRIAATCLGPGSPVSLLSDLLPAVLLVTLPGGGTPHSSTAAGDSSTCSNAGSQNTCIAISKHAVLPSIAGLVRLGEAIQPYTAGGAASASPSGQMKAVFSVGNTLNMLEFLHSSVLPLLLARSAALEAASIFDLPQQRSGNGSPTSSAELAKYATIFAGGTADVDAKSTEIEPAAETSSAAMQAPMTASVLPRNEFYEHYVDAAFASESTSKTAETFLAMFVKYAAKKDMAFGIFWKKGTFQPVVKVLLAALLKHLNASTVANTWINQPETANDDGALPPPPPPPPPIIATIFDVARKAHTQLQQKGQSLRNLEKADSIPDFLLNASERLKFIVTKFNPAVDIELETAAASNATGEVEGGDDVGAQSSGAIRKPFREPSAMTWSAFAEDASALRRKSSWLETKLPEDKEVSSDEKLATTLVMFALNEDAPSQDAILAVVKAANAGSRRQRHGFEAFSSVLTMADSAKNKLFTPASRAMAIAGWGGAPFAQAATPKLSMQLHEGSIFVSKPEQRLLAGLTSSLGSQALKHLQRCTTKLEAYLADTGGHLVAPFAGVVADQAKYEEMTAVVRELLSHLGSVTGVRRPGALEELIEGGIFATTKRVQQLESMAACNSDSLSAAAATGEDGTRTDGSNAGASSAVLPCTQNLPLLAAGTVAATVDRVLTMQVAANVDKLKANVVEAAVVHFIAVLESQFQTGKDRHEWGRLCTSLRLLRSVVAGNDAIGKIAKAHAELINLLERTVASGPLPARISAILSLETVLPGMCNANLEMFTDLPADATTSNATWCMSCATRLFGLLASSKCPATKNRLVQLIRFLSRHHPVWSEVIVAYMREQIEAAVCGKDGANEVGRGKGGGADEMPNADAETAEDDNNQTSSSSSPSPSLPPKPPQPLLSGLAPVLLALGNTQRLVSVGSTVSHPEFGHGVVVDADMEKCVLSRKQNVLQTLVGPDASSTASNAYHGVFFDIKAGQTAVRIDGIVCGSKRGAGSTGTLYTCRGTHVGKQEVPKSWTTASRSVVLEKGGVNTTMLDTPVVVEARMTQAFYLHGAAHSNAVAYLPGSARVEWSSTTSDLKIIKGNFSKAPEPFTKVDSGNRHFAGGVVYAVLGPNGSADSQNKPANLIHSKMIVPVSSTAPAASPLELAGSRGSGGSDGDTEAVRVGPPQELSFGASPENCSASHHGVFFEATAGAHDVQISGITAGWSHRDPDPPQAAILYSSGLPLEESHWKDETVWTEVETLSFDAKGVACKNTLGTPVIIQAGTSCGFFLHSAKIHLAYTPANPSPAVGPDANLTLKPSKACLDEKPFVSFHSGSDIYLPAGMLTYSIMEAGLPATPAAGGSSSGVVPSAVPVDGGGGGAWPLPTSTSSPMSPNPPTSQGTADPASQVPLAIGAAVVRGPDWHYSDQDGGEGSGVGEIIPDDEDDDDQDGWATVRWQHDGSENSYEMGYDGLYTLQLQTPLPPTPVVTVGPAVVGAGASMGTTAAAAASAVVTVGFAIDAEEEGGGSAASRYSLQNVQPTNSDAPPVVNTTTDLQNAFVGRVPDGAKCVDVLFKHSKLEQMAVLGATVASVGAGPLAQCTVKWGLVFVLSSEEDVAKTRSYNHMTDTAYSRYRKQRNLLPPSEGCGPFMPVGILRRSRSSDSTLDAQMDFGGEGTHVLLKLFVAEQRHPALVVVNSVAIEAVPVNIDGDASTTSLEGCEAAETEPTSSPSASAEERAAQRDTYRCIEGGGGVALRNSPVFSDRGLRGPEDKALVEAIGKPEVHNNLEWIPLANGSWLPLTTESKSKVLFELVPELSNIASQVASGPTARILPSEMVSPTALAVEFQKGDRVLRGDDVQMLELSCIDAIQFGDVTMKELEPFARLVAFAMDTTRVPVDPESATLLALALSAARKLNLHPGIRHALASMPTLPPPSQSQSDASGNHTGESGLLSATSPFVQFASLARSPSGLLANFQKRDQIESVFARSEGLMALTTQPHPSSAATDDRGGCAENVTVAVDSERARKAGYTDVTPSVRRGDGGEMKAFVVSGAGSAAVNGLYTNTTVSGYSGASPYAKVGNPQLVMIRWERAHWILIDMGPDRKQFPSDSSAPQYYKVTSSADLPPGAGWETEGAGADPAPSLRAATPSEMALVPRQFNSPNGPIQFVSLPLNPLATSLWDVKVSGNDSFCIGVLPDSERDNKNFVMQQATIGVDSEKTSGTCQLPKKDIYEQWVTMRYDGPTRIASFSYADVEAAPGEEVQENNMVTKRVGYDGDICFGVCSFGSGIINIRPSTGSASQEIFQTSDGILRLTRETDNTITGWLISNNAPASSGTTTPSFQGATQMLFDQKTSSCTFIQRALTAGTPNCIVGLNEGYFLEEPDANRVISKLKRLARCSNTKCVWSMKGFGIDCVVKISGSFADPAAQGKVGCIVALGSIDDEATGPIPVYTVQLEDGAHVEGVHGIDLSPAAVTSKDAALRAMLDCVFTGDAKVPLTPATATAKNKRSITQASEMHIGPWTKHLDPGSKLFYYFNQETGVSSWDKPTLEESPAKTADAGVAANVGAVPAAAAVAASSADDTETSFDNADYNAGDDVFVLSGASTFVEPPSKCAPVLTVIRAWFGPDPKKPWAGIDVTGILQHLIVHGDELSIPASGVKDLFGALVDRAANNTEGTTVALTQWMIRADQLLDQVGVAAGAPDKDPHVVVSEVRSNGEAARMINIDDVIVAVDSTAIESPGHWATVLDAGGAGVDLADQPAVTLCTERLVKETLLLEDVDDVTVDKDRCILYLKCEVAGATSKYIFNEGQAVWLNANCAITIPNESMEMPGAVILNEKNESTAAGAAAMAKARNDGDSGSGVSKQEQLGLVNALAQFSKPALDSTLCQLVSSLRVCCAREMLGSWLSSLPTDLSDPVLEILLDNLRMATHGRFPAGSEQALAVAIARSLPGSPRIEAIVAKCAISELAACTLASSSKSKEHAFKVVESAHNYPNDANLSGTVVIPGATRLKVTFDPKCHTESGFDVLVIQDGQGKECKRISGDCGVPRWQSFELSGDTLKWQFTSDAQRNFWGYKFKVMPVVSTTADPSHSDADVLEKSSITMCKLLVEMLLGQQRRRHFEIPSTRSALASGLSAFALDTSTEEADRVWALGELSALLGRGGLPPPDTAGLVAYLQNREGAILPTTENSEDTASTDAAAPLKIGDMVRVKPTVAKPRHGWGTVTHAAVGRLMEINRNGKDCKVDFPGNSRWSGSLAEMERVGGDGDGKQKRAPLPTVSESENAQVQMISSMGFHEEQALFAFLAAGRKVEEALELILTGGVPEWPYGEPDDDDEEEEEEVLAGGGAGGASGAASGPPGSVFEVTGAGVEDANGFYALKKASGADGDGGDAESGGGGGFVAVDGEGNPRAGVASCGVAWSSESEEWVFTIGGGLVKTFRNRAEGGAPEMDSSLPPVAGWETYGSDEPCPQLRYTGEAKAPVHPTFGRSPLSNLAEADGTSDDGVGAGDATVVSCEPTNSFEVLVRRLPVLFEAQFSYEHPFQHKAMRLSDYFKALCDLALQVGLHQVRLPFKSMAWLRGYDVATRVATALVSGAALAPEFISQAIESPLWHRWVTEITEEAWMPAQEKLFDSGAFEAAGYSSLKVDAEIVRWYPDPIPENVLEDSGVFPASAEWTHSRYEGKTFTRTKNSPKQWECDMAARDAKNVRHGAGCATDDQSRGTVHFKSTDSTAVTICRRCMVHMGRVADQRGENFKDAAAFQRAQIAVRRVADPGAFSIIKELPVPVLECRAAVLQCLVEDGLLHNERLPVILSSNPGLLSKLSRIIPHASKHKIIMKQIAATMDVSEDHRPRLELNRLGLVKDDATGYIGANGTKSVFAQVMEQMEVKEKEVTGLWLRNKWLFKVESLAGEGIDDAGGGYSEIVSHMMLELAVEASPDDANKDWSALPLLVRTPNGRDDNSEGYNRDTLLLNPDAVLPVHMQMFRFLGIMIGAAIRTDQPIELPLAPCMWELLLGRSLAGESLIPAVGRGPDDGSPNSPLFGDGLSGGGLGAAGSTSSDGGFAGTDGNSVDFMAALNAIEPKLAEFDLNSMSKLRQLAVEPEEFLEYREDFKFDFFRASGTAVVVVDEPGLVLNGETRAAFVSACLRMRCHEFDKQVAAVRAGIREVLPIQLLPLLTGAELAELVCGDTDFDVERLREVTHCEGYAADAKQVQWLWTVLKGFNPEQKSQFLRFTGGFTRLPHDIEKLTHRFEVHRSDHPENLPEAATCFFTIKIPEYRNIEVLRSKLLVAMQNCGAIDADGGGGDFEVMDA